MSYIQEAVREWVWVHGAECPECEWISSPYDSWEKNPHYTGKPGRHPEDDYGDDDSLPEWANELPVDDPLDSVVAAYRADDDDIPF